MWYPIPSSKGLYEINEALDVRSLRSGRLISVNQKCVMLHLNGICQHRSLSSLRKEVFGTPKNNCVGCSVDSKKFSSISEAADYIRSCLPFGSKNTIMRYMHRRKENIWGFKIKYER